MTYHQFPPLPPPVQPPQLECPQCGRHTVVMHGEGLYVCLSCDWIRDLNRMRHHHGSRSFPGPLLIFLILIALLLALAGAG